ncbi:carboxymuconolactone decarboxylase family protein [Alkalibacter rhizosphaerae]|uniref:Carboxymuconolactone decarboxylase family protein n=1 Tax=Alkalibacter rhizosphaerae TaxID=2815577 RepID=A0A974XER1_9FIRM|nr:carboxymuconolactone decarboxylase family protein [Alkalibacter rhizosphaerae]QSX08504.1 carboxymuconolactone decarboxylase family protein [Alkalibacter rhizosphaerae]
MRIHENRKLHSVLESYFILMKGMRTVRYMAKARRSGELSQPFVERLMLAVTEVNGCLICSYAHTKMALEAGLKNEEIQRMLAGEFEDAPVEELPAILFAQHYTESRGKPSRKAWDRIVDVYGEPKALRILGAIRMIMIGNAYGIPWSSLTNRLKGKPDPRSNLAYELTMLLTMIPFTIVAMVHGKMKNAGEDPMFGY